MASAPDAAIEDSPGQTVTAAVKSDGVGGYIIP